MKDGRVFVGTMEEDGDEFIIKTKNGKVRVKKSQVAKIAKA